MTLVKKKTAYCKIDKEYEKWYHKADMAEINIIILQFNGKLELRNWLNREEYLYTFFLNKKEFFYEKIPSDYLFVQ